MLHQASFRVASTHGALDFVGAASGRGCLLVQWHRRRQGRGWQGQRRQRWQDRGAREPSAVAAAAPSGSGAVAVTGKGRPDGKARPNILFVLADDQRADTLSCMPKLGKLLARGTTFKNNFASTPLCCPGRSSVLLANTPTTTGCSRTETSRTRTRVAGGHRLPEEWQRVEDLRRVAPAEGVSHRVLRQVPERLRQDPRDRADPHPAPLGRVARLLADRDILTSTCWSAASARPRRRAAATSRTRRRTTAIARARRRARAPRPRRATARRTPKGRRRARRRSASARASPTRSSATARRTTPPTCSAIR